MKSTGLLDKHKMIIMRCLAAYDRWCSDRVEGVLVWLEEWISLSQKWAERGLLAVYVGAYLSTVDWTSVLVGSTRVLGQVLGLAVVAFMMWRMHRRPAMRRGLYKNDSFGCMRVCVQAMIVLVIAAALVGGRGPQKWCVSTAQLSFLIFYYLVDIGSTGQRGRKCKIAWAELKKLFGTEWMPKPLMAPH
jgi:hypothetical protein